MSEDAPTLFGNYRLRTHELAPVLLPRARALSSPSPTSPERKEFPAVLPARPRGSIGRVSSPCRGRTRLESVAFDPFSDSESFKLLLQNPEASSVRRGDPRAVSAFRQWLSQCFPHLLLMFRALGMTQAQSDTLQGKSFAEALVEYNEPCANQCSIPFDEAEEDAEDEQEVDREQCWSLMLRHATVLSATPNETLALQSITRAESVYFLLNGHCELSFRPVLLRDSKTSTPSSLPRMPAISLDRPVMRLRELTAGDCFGLDAAAFGFDYHISTATAGNARQRSLLGLREMALTYALCLPYTVVQQLQLLQRRHHNNCDRLPPAFPYSFAAEAEMFLRNTFLFHAMTDSSRCFLAAHLHQVDVAQQEYLFTPGQPVRVFIVISGQLTLGAPREEHAGARNNADLELELLQSHDAVGLTEVLRLAPSFERYCVVTSSSGARVYTLPSTVLLMVLAQESSSLKQIHEWISQRKSWFELRTATALAQRKKLVAEDSQHVVRLTLAAQRRSKLTCSRCGWAGHVSTSSSCMRVNDFADNSGASLSSQLDSRGRKSRGGSRAARQQTRRSHSPRCSETIEVISVAQPLPPATLTSPSRTHPHRRLQVDSIALRALRISTISMIEHLPSNESTDRDEETRDEKFAITRAASMKNTKEGTVRSCALTQSFHRLETALQQDKTLSVTPRQKVNSTILHISS